MSDEIQAIYHLPIGSQREHKGLLLTLTEEGWRAEVQHSMMRRCKDWDYCQPWIYLVTIGCQQQESCPLPTGIGNDDLVLPLPEGWRYPEWLRQAYAKQGRPHLFGELAGASADDAHIALNAFGQEVQQLVQSLPAAYPQLSVIESIVMPNHLHMVLRIKERLPEKTPLGIVINKFKSWVNRAYKEVALGLPATTLMDLSYQQARTVSSSQSGTVSSSQSGTVPSSQSGTVLSSQSGTVLYSAPEAQNTRRHGTHPKVGLVFEPGFHDRILFREGQLQRMIDYCRDNPRRLWMVRHNSQYFHTVGGIKLTMPVLAESGTRGRSRWMGPVEGLLEPITYSQPDGESATPPAGIVPTSQTVTFSAVGNLSLLKAPERMQIQCSRSMTEAAVETLKAEVLEACKHGVVPISPCISPGERIIARAVMEEGHQLIALFPQGIPEDTTYKPYKEFFDVCASGQLLLMSPWKFEDGRKHLARWQCLFLNDIAMQLMVGMTTLAS